MKMEKRKTNKYRILFDVIENKLLKLSIVIYIIIWISSYWLLKYKSNDFMVELLINKLGRHLTMSDSSLVTVATVFIGIYFTIYTMLISIQSDSVLANLEKTDFKKILRILTVGFVSSFIYTFYSIFFQLSYNSSKVLTSFAVLFLALIFLISAFQFGTLLTLILTQDIYGAIKKINERKSDEARKEEILTKLEIFLVEKENERYEEEDRKQSERMKNGSK